MKRGEFPPFLLWCKKQQPEKKLNILALIGAKCAIMVINRNDNGARQTTRKPKQ